MQPIRRTDLPAHLLHALQLTEVQLGRSYSPHSGLCVAAGLWGPEGMIITGVNYECDSYGLTLCAERTALARAQVEGSISQVTGLMLSACWRTGAAPCGPLTPCGACRQWLAELAHRLGRDLPVHSFWYGQEEGLISSALALMPGAFHLCDESPVTRAP